MLKDFLHNLKICTERVMNWVEWMDAKYWAKQFHPAWVEIATKCHSETARTYYKELILKEYRGLGYGESNGR